MNLGYGFLAAGAKYRKNLTANKGSINKTKEIKENYLFIDEIRFNIGAGKLNGFDRE